MRHESLSVTEAVIGGVLVGITTPNGHLGVWTWQWFLYIGLMNLIVNMAYGVGKAWWLDRHIRAARRNENKA
jgi:hypothetical protein